MARKKYLNSDGFSAIHALLVLIVIGIVGFTGWYVWNTDQQATDDLKAAGTTIVKKESQKSTDKSAEISTPAGYIAYTNDKYGFSFAYPESWGSAEASEENTGRVDVIFKATDGQVGQYHVVLHKESIAHLDTDSPTLNIAGFDATSNNIAIQYAGGGNSEVTSDHILKNNATGVIYKMSTDEVGFEWLIALKHISAGNYKVVILSSPVVSSSSDVSQQTSYLTNMLATFKSTN